MMQICNKCTTEKMYECHCKCIGNEKQRTDRDLIVNLAAEVAELKRKVIEADYKAGVALTELARLNDEINGMRGSALDGEK